MFHYHIYKRYIKSSRHHVAYSISGLLYILLVYAFIRNRGTLKSEKKHMALSVESAAEDEYLHKKRNRVDTEEMILLEKAFTAADFDGNKELSLSELQMEVAKRTRDHIMVDWEEYYDYYVREWLSLDTATLELLQKSPHQVPRELKECISRLRAAWSEVARSNPNKLNIDEFLALEHPESSMSSIIIDVEQLMIKHDMNEDNKITREEYSKDPYRDLNPDEILDRQTEFDEGLDANKNGIADKREIIRFLDPKNQFWAKHEARRLMAEGDKDGNGYVSLQEVLEHSTSFLDSKFVDPGKAFHNH